MPELTDSPSLSVETGLMLRRSKGRLRALLRCGEIRNVSKKCASLACPIPERLTSDLPPEPQARLGRGSRSKSENVTQERQRAGLLRESRLPSTRRPDRTGPERAQTPVARPSGRGSVRGLHVGRPRPAA